MYFNKELYKEIRHLDIILLILYEKNRLYITFREASDEDSIIYSTSK